MESVTIKLPSQPPSEMAVDVETISRLILAFAGVDATRDADSLFNYVEKWVLILARTAKKEDSLRSKRIGDPEDISDDENPLRDQDTGLPSPIKQEDPERRISPAHVPVQPFSNTTEIRNFEFEAPTADCSSHAPDTPTVTEEAIEENGTARSELLDTAIDTSSPSEISLESDASCILYPATQPAELTPPTAPATPTQSTAYASSVPLWSRARSGPLKISAAVWADQLKIHRSGMRETFSFTTCAVDKPAHIARERLLEEILEKIRSDDFWSCIPLKYLKKRVDPLDTSIPYLKFVLVCVEAQKEIGC